MTNLRSVVRTVCQLLEVCLHWALGLVYGGPGDHMPPITNLLLLESATSLAFKIRNKKVTSVEVVNSFIDRIAEVNPILNAVVDRRFEAARAEAAECDALVQSGAISEQELAKDKPFLGVPFTTKDCIAVEGMLHTAGLHKRRTKTAKEDADVIANMRQAGAIPIALTNVSELCMWWESNNPVHGRTSNPYNTNRIVGGSSGGEGCLQACAGSAFGVGSDIGGSIRMPAFFNGVFGHKPSWRVVSNRGQFPKPLSAEQDLFNGIGPICRHADDLGPLLKCMAGRKADVLRLDDKVSVKDLRVFYQEDDAGALMISRVHADVKDALRKVLFHFEKAHKIKPQRIENKLFRYSIPIWMAAMKVQNGPTFGEQLVNQEGPFHLYWEVMKWFVRASSHTFIALMTCFIEKFGVQYGSEQYDKSLRQRDQLVLELGDMLGPNGVLLYPTHPTPAPYHNEPLFKPFNFAYTAIFNILGFPATNVPLGLSKNGLPVGVQVVANINQDRLCLAVARDLEKAFGGWSPPVINA